VRLLQNASTNHEELDLAVGLGTRRETGYYGTPMIVVYKHHNVPDRQGAHQG
jgi:hypothetical protein